MDQQAFNSFYRQTQPLIYGYVLRLCGDPHLAEDILQEAYLRFMERPPKQEAFAAQKAYLYTIASRMLADHFRKKEKMKLAAQNIPGEEAETKNKIKEDDPAIEEALSMLSNNDKTMLWLAYVEGYGHKEIGQVMKLRPGSIKVMLSRARQRLRDLLQGKQKNI